MRWVLLAHHGRRASALRGQDVHAQAFGEGSYEARSRIRSRRGAGVRLGRKRASGTREGGGAARYLQFRRRELLRKYAERRGNADAETGVE